MNLPQHCWFSPKTVPSRSSADTVVVGDVLVVRAGQSIPVEVSSRGICRRSDNGGPLYLGKTVGDSVTSARYLLAADEDACHRCYDDNVVGIIRLADERRQAPKHLSSVC